MAHKHLVHFAFVMSVLIAACTPIPQMQAPVAPTSTPVPTATATVPVPTAAPAAYVGGSVPCFAGPNVDDNIVSTVDITDHPEILGADTSGAYWTIERKDLKGYCWIEAQYVTVVGQTSEMAVIVPTRTPIPPVPSAPKNVVAKFKCFMGRYPNRVDAIIDWEADEGANGYRIYLDDQIVAELIGSETHYQGTMKSDLWPSASGLAIYTIEAYNATGSSEFQVPISWHCYE